VADPGQIRLEPFNSIGMVEDYGLLASDIAALAICAFFLRETLLALFQKKQSKLFSILRHQHIRVFLLCWLVYFLFSFFSSFIYSFYPAFSLTHLFQIMKMPVMFLSTLYILASYKTHSAYLAKMIEGTIFLQVIMGVYQFIIGLVQHQTQRYIPNNAIGEEFYSLPRPQGTTLFANEYGFFLLLLGWNYLMMRHKRPPLLSILVISFALVGILLSQSRTVWLVLLIALLMWVRLRWQTLTARVGPFMRKWGGLRILPFALLLSLPLVLPRVESLSYAFDQGSGSLRLQMMTEGLAALREQYITGFGVNTPVYTLLDLFPKGYIRDFPYAPHMGYLQMALESGIIAMIAFFLPFLIQLRSNAAALLIHGWNQHQAFSLMLLSCLLLYYLLQPYGGAFELPFLGLFFGISVYYTTPWSTR
jgi:hypothetical protein